MQDIDKTKDQLIDELNEMRQRVAELETAQACALDVENAPLSYQSLDENGYFLAVNRPELVARYGPVSLSEGKGVSIRYNFDIMVCFSAHY